MRLGTKLGYAKKAVLSISRHDDLAAAGRSRALAELESFIAAERQALQAREEESLARELSPPPGGEPGNG